MVLRPGPAEGRSVYSSCYDKDSRKEDQSHLKPSHHSVESLTFIPNLQVIPFQNRESYPVLSPPPKQGEEQELIKEGEPKALPPDQKPHWDGPYAKCFPDGLDLGPSHRDGKSNWRFRGSKELLMGH